MQNNLYTNLDKYWQKVVDDLVQSLKDVGRYASGNTAQAIGDGNAQPVVVTASGFKITIVMPNYYEFLDEGVSGAKNNTGISRFSFKDKGKGKNGRGQKGIPPIKAIRRFMLNRGINAPRTSNTKSGKRQDAEKVRNGIAYAIAYKVWRDGTKRTDFYTNVINDKKLLAFEQMLLTQYSDYVLEIIRAD